MKGTLKAVLISDKQHSEDYKQVTFICLWPDINIVNFWQHHDSTGPYIVDL